MEKNNLNKQEFNLHNSDATMGDLFRFIEKEDILKIIFVRPVWRRTIFAASSMRLSSPKSTENVFENCSPTDKSFKIC